MKKTNKEKQNDKIDDAKKDQLLTSLRLFPAAFLNGISGSIGGYTCMRMKSGKIFVRRKGRKRLAPATAAEKKNRRRFKRAVDYAREVLRNPEKKAIYRREAATRYISAFSLAVRDHMRSPVVQEVDPSSYTGKKGGIISFRAEDNFELATVKVVIRDRAGTCLEVGRPAREGREVRWHYKVQKDLPPGQVIQIEITATDHAGNTSTTRTIHLTGQEKALLKAVV